MYTRPHESTPDVDRPGHPEATGTPARCQLPGVVGASAPVAGQVLSRPPPRPSLAATSCRYGRAVQPFDGQSLERLAALSDGVFAVAMTLLVLDVRVPASAALASSDHALWGALLKLGPSFAAYLLSFTMLGTFWLAQHTLPGILGRAAMDAEEEPLKLRTMRTCSRRDVGRGRGCSPAGQEPVQVPVVGVGAASTRERSDASGWGRHDSGSAVISPRPVVSACSSAVVLDEVRPQCTT